jgi:hypothetical protein
VPQILTAPEPFSGHRNPKSLSEFQAHTTTPRGGRCFYRTNRDLASVYYIIFSYELAPGCFTRAGEGPIEIGCRADQGEMRECLRKVSEMLAVRPQFLGIQAKMIGVS